MKLVHIVVQVQYTEAVEAILVAREVAAWTRNLRVAGRDRDGRHEGSQAFPGQLAAFVARLDDGRVDGLLESLREFRDARTTHGHLEAYVLPVEHALLPDEDPPDGAPERGE
jgi:hypothetical protein